MKYVQSSKQYSDISYRKLIIPSMVFQRLNILQDIDKLPIKCGDQGSKKNTNTTHLRADIIKRIHMHLQH